MALQQTLRFCTAADGVRIAIAAAGSGPPLVRASHWLSHVEYDLESPVWRPWLEALSASYTYVRYDQRGCGLSDRNVDRFDLEAWVGDLEAVADTLGPEPFPLLGMSQGGAVAITYALRHPERVSRLILVGAYGRGQLRRDGGEADRLEAETLVNLIRLGWGQENPAFRHVFTNRFIPEGTPDQHCWWTDLERMTATAEDAARTLEGFQRIDVMERARQIRHPTLVMHARGDACVPFDEGRLLAAQIPKAHFVPLESKNHVLLATEPAWTHFLSELHSFLKRDTSHGSAAVAARFGDLTAAEAAVLSLLTEGLDNRSIAQRLGKQEKTVRNQLSSIFAKLDVHSRTEAIVLAREMGS